MINHTTNSTGKQHSHPHHLDEEKAQEDEDLKGNKDLSSPTGNDLRLINQRFSSSEKKQIPNL